MFVLKDGRFSNDFFGQRMRWVPRRFHALNRHLLNADPPLFFRGPERLPVTL